MSDELDAKLEAATALFNPETLDSGGHFFALVKVWERRDVEIILCRLLRTGAKATTPAPSRTPTGTPTATTTLEAMGEIMDALTNGRITPADAKARLYAHQIALSALRTIDNARARRQKEERLRTQQTAGHQRTTSSASPRTPAPTASPRREAQRRNRPVPRPSRRTSKRTPASARKK
jgi:hypothetical protein